MLATMWRSKVMPKLVRQLGQFGSIRAQTVLYSHSTFVQDKTPIQRTENASASFENHCSNDTTHQHLSRSTSKRHIGENVSRKDKIGFLVNILMDLDDNKEAVYNVLDAWVAWEQDFPIGPLRKALINLEKEQQWHRVIHVIKWMLSKGQGTTMGTYGQLIRALDKDHRAEEAHVVWVKKIGVDLRTAPWDLCRSIISVYYRNNMLDCLVKLVKDLEAFGRTLPDKMTVQRVADTYEILGSIEEKEQVLDKYKKLFVETSSPKKSERSSPKEGRTSRRKKHKSH